MDKLLALASFALGVIVVFVTPSDGAVAVLVTVLFSSIAILIIRTQSHDHKLFLTRIFVLALLVRLAFGIILHAFDLRDVFGADAHTYDQFGFTLMNYWFYGAPDLLTEQLILERIDKVGWGMLYLVAGIYSAVGRNILAAQFFCAVIGAAIAPIIYLCSYTIFNNRRVAQAAAVLVALYPSFIIWTSQLMKDGLIIFLLVLSILLVLRLQKKLNYFEIALIIFSLFAIISLRFYIFYFISVAIVGNFVIGYGSRSSNLLRKLAILSFLGVSLLYLGVIQYANTEFDNFGSLEVLQRSRDDAADRSESGFGQGTDISTPTGALLTLPLGLTYLLLAPFPWQMSNLRQIMTLPDMLIWWSSIPFLISGLIYSVKHRLRGSIGILIFTAMLSMAYSIVQGNVGTIYRQRTQIQVFLFIFVGVGWTIYQERKENKKVKDKEKQRKLDLRWRNKQQQQINFFSENTLHNKTNTAEKPPQSNNKINFEQKSLVSDSEDSLTETPIPQQPKLEEQSCNSDIEKKSSKLLTQVDKQEIIKIQEILKEQNIYDGKISGRLNKKFRKAIKYYQSEKNLQITGTLNKETLQSLRIKLFEKQDELSS